MITGNPEILFGVTIGHQQDIRVSGADHLLQEGFVARGWRTRYTAYNHEASVGCLQDRSGLFSNPGRRAKQKEPIPTFSGELGEAMGEPDAGHATAQGRPKITCGEQDPYAVGGTEIGLRKYLGKARVASGLIDKFRVDRTDLVGTSAFKHRGNPRDGLRFEHIVNRYAKDLHSSWMRQDVSTFIFIGPLAPIPFK